MKVSMLFLVYFVFVFAYFSCYIDEYQVNNIKKSVETTIFQKKLSAFSDLRYGMYIHFNMGTFTGQEWAAPNQDPLTFAPTNVDTDQWATVVKNAKMKFGILTTKHHDGFCLWPTATTTYNVMNSGYKQDIVKKFTDSFRAQDLKVGLYFSTWDKTQDVQAYNNGRHGVSGTKYIDQADIDYTLAQVTELMTNYGKIDIFIIDGYAWQAGFQAVPYQKVHEVVKSLQPDCILIENCAANEPLLGDVLFYEEPLGITSPAGNTYASCQGQTILPSNKWFWKTTTPTDTMMSFSSILSHLTDLESKYTTFILNCPPNRVGQFDTNIVARLNEVAASWSPNTSRPPLPIQQTRVIYPITAKSAYATSEHVGEWAPNAIDGRHDKDYQTCWSTWSSGTMTMPQSITINLGGEWSNVSGLEYLPKQWSRNESTDGDITSYIISTSTDGINFTEKTSGNWDGNKKTKLAQWTACNVGYIRLQAITATGGYVNVSELRIGGLSEKPVLVSTAYPLFESTGDYKIINYTSQRALDGNVSAGSTALQRSWNGSDNLKWEITDLGNGYYKMINKANNLVLDGSGGTNLIMNDWNEASSYQQWQLTNLGQGYYLLANKGNNLAIDSTGSTPDGADVKLWSWDGSNNLRWVIEKVQ